MASTTLRVKELLQQRNWTTKVLAEKTSMSESYLTHIKNGTRRWNEDALRKIALAFNVDPLDLFVDRKPIVALPPASQELVTEEVSLTHSLMKVPVMGDLPSYPSPYHNQLLQVATGYKDIFVPFIGSKDPNMFCLYVENNSLLPKFSKGDFLFISPQTAPQGGSIVAVEYKTDKMYKGIMQISLAEDVIVLNAVHHKHPPIALSKSRDTFRIIGTIVWRYQKMP